MAENVTKEEMEKKFTEGMEIVAHNMVAYGEKLSASQKVEFESTMAPVIEELKALGNRMNAVDIIDSEDGVETVLERLNKLNEQLESYGNLEEVLGNIDVLKTDVADIKTALNDLNTAVATAQSTADDAVSRANSASQKADENTQAIADVKSEISEGIDTTIKPRLDKQREELNSLNSVVHDKTDADGVVTEKGLVSKVTDIENNFLNSDSIKAIDLSKGDARMKEILGLTSGSNGDGETA